MNMTNKSQLNLLNETIRKARKSDLYKVKFTRFQKSLKSIAELEKMPFTTKKELRDCYPFGALAVPVTDVVELHTSSGTTGKAALSFLTKEDLKNSSKAIAKAWECFGITKDSRVQFMMSYGLFSGATLNTYAIQELGGFVVPAGIQSAEKQIQMMLDFKIDTIVGTVGYYFYLFDYIKEKQIPLEQFSLKRGIMAGEIYSDKVRMEVERKFKIKIFDHYGLCEVNTGIAYECEFRAGLHLLDDYVLPEIIDPESGEVLPLDHKGELVLTTLKKNASPLIRYRTGDITSIKSGKCPCGRNSVRIDRIKRRVDDILFIKGIKIDPYELKEFLLEIAGDNIFSDIKIRVGSSFENYSPEILVSLKNPPNTNFLLAIQRKLKEKTLLTFDVKHISRDYFQRGENNKVKFVEYVNKK
jgi:phenylacetate-CoA ligase